MDQNTPKSVLIIEDDKPLLHALQLKLGNAGFTVTPADSGQKGLQLINNNKFDIIVLDLIMPLIDGFQVLEGIKFLPYKPRILVLTNLEQPEDRKRALDAGAHKFFIKTNTPLSSLVDEIKNL